MSVATLLLSRSDLGRLLDIGECLDALRQGFLAAPAGPHGRGHRRGRSG
jgi:hypothetical protein